MDWPTTVVENWAHFTDLAARLAVRRPQDKFYATRGHADESWTLQPSLLRCLPEDATANEALDVETLGLREFRSQAHLHLSAASLPAASPKPSVSEWWCLMQYHGAPTRLLDWTDSPYVAAYYAVEQLPKKNGALFVVHTGTVNRSLLKEYPQGTFSDEELFNPDSAPGLVFFTPIKRTDRLVAQQGRYSLSVRILGVHEDLIGEPCSQAGRENPGKLLFQKWIIPANLKPEFLYKLRAMNITGHSLFPGIDGAGRSVAEAARLASQPRPQD